MPLSAKLTSPKRAKGKVDGRNNWYPYYAGFSEQFVGDLLENEKPGVVLDPWVGSGTTVQIGSELGHKSIGFDLNPVMVVIARAKLISHITLMSAESLALQIVKNAKSFGTEYKDEPLAEWFRNDSAKYIRSLVKSIETVLVKNTDSPEPNTLAIDNLSDLACFFLLAIFRVVRKFLARFSASNPTWIKKPDSKRSRCAPSQIKIEEKFLQEIALLIQNNSFSIACPIHPTNNSMIGCGTSTKLNIEDSAVDYIITSPPYCTRLDYAVATSLELATLGYSPEEVSLLRKSLLGSTAIANRKIVPSENWGKECLSLCEKIRNHTSRASKNYYLKTYYQYFSDLSISLNESKRVLDNNGKMYIVVQDSYYKEISVKLSSIVRQQAECSGLSFQGAKKFLSKRNMARINSKAWKASSSNTYEHVLVFNAT